MNNKFMPIKLPGTRYVAFKSQIIVSSGVVTLDSILGGGIPVGTLFLIEEDEDNIFGEIFFKYYYTEGLACGHRVFVTALDGKTRNIIYRLPEVVEPGSSQDTNENNFEMKIAWRYQGNPEVNSQPSRPTSANLGHQFDLSNNIPSHLINSSPISCYQEGNTYRDLLVQISKLILERKDTVVRIGIHGIGTALWKSPQSEIIQFLFNLRALIHGTTSVVIISLPTDLIQDPTILGRCEHLCDTVIRLESLVNSSNPLYADYKGLIKFIKFPCVNSIASHVPEAQDWGFKLLRKKFIIEKLHLPPELQQSTQREQDDLASLACGSINKPMIDF